LIAALDVMKNEKKSKIRSKHMNMSIQKLGDVRARGN
jgi:hypothetical protein